ncbi:hypothetical protein ACQEWB_42500 [Streptomyces sp. CA-249302]|uniref:hypothetical protein n=1 Tax=Streptomyces sp. CA-249302 TaxID=3240058 RepID=UPI003D8AE695
MQWARALGTIALLCLAGGLAVPVADEYHERQTYRHASVCPGGQGSAGKRADCLVPGTGQVTGKTSWTRCDSYGDVAPDSCTRGHRLRLDMRFAGERRTESLHVGADTYRRAGRGDRAELLVWHGEVVRLTVRGHTERLDPYFGVRWTPLAWLAGAWFALGAAAVVALGYVRRLRIRWWSPSLLGFYCFPGAAVGLVLEGVLFDGRPVWAWILAAVCAAVTGALALMSLLTSDLHVRRRRA